MAKELILKLGKVLIAAAWADEQVTHEELNSLKDLLFRLRQLTGREWSVLEMYLERPISADERSRLVEELNAAIASPSDKRLALSALDELVRADGVVTESEQAVLNEVNAAIDSAEVGLFGKLSRLLHGAMRRRSEKTINTTNREDGFEDFIKNKVYHSLCRRLDTSELELNVPERDLRKLCLSAGLMARVAHVDREVTQDEFDGLVKALQTGWRVTREEAAFVAEVAVSEVIAGTDYFRLTRQFFEATAPDERAKFLDVLFAVADADGRVSYDEIEEIRSITRSLKLSHRQFINAKVRIPDERRAT